MDSAKTIDIQYQDIRSRRINAVQRIEMQNSMLAVYPAEHELEDNHSNGRYSKQRSRFETLPVACSYCANTTQRCRPRPNEESRHNSPSATLDSDDIVLVSACHK